ncbi:MAG: phosphoribosylformylglycinamidine synthase I [Candidatus Hydrothermales bacterium]
MDAYVIFAPGTNCEEETLYALRKIGLRADILLLKKWLANPSIILKSRLLVFPGGFSFGDYIKAGKVLAYYIREKLWAAIKKFYEEGGYIIGICNGFQVLLRAGILPFFDGKVRAYLLRNENGEFEDRWVFLKGEGESIFVRGLEGINPFPIAHGEGRFYADESVIEYIEKNKMVAFRYVDKEGSPAKEYPFNPNGSLNSIAGITDYEGRILGMMPHPERAFEKFQIPYVFELDREPGFLLFKNVALKVKEGETSKV